MQSLWTERLKTQLSRFKPGMVCFLSAVRFLTVVPVRWGREQDGENFRQSLKYFPVIGALIGGAVAGASLILGLYLPCSVVSVIALILLSFVSGCLHLDGLADTADGFLSSRPKEKILEIMKDSRTGAMGVIAIVTIMLLKFSSLSTLQNPLFLKTIFLMPIAGRCAIVFSMALLRYARPEGGLGALFYSDSCRKSAIWCGVFLALLVPFVGLQAMMMVVAVTCSTVLAFAAWCRRKIGGATGDTLGAVCEMTEAAVAVGMTVFIGF